jgi:hypothetical protein
MREPLQEEVHHNPIQASLADHVANGLGNLTLLPPVGLQLEESREKPETREDLAQLHPREVTALTTVDTTVLWVEWDAWRG